MKKNRMMRAASALLVAVLMTTCTISGTFAKYTTSASGTDTARVAKWGVEVTATSADTFAKTYATDDLDVKGTIANSVVSDVDVVAPGTKNDNAAIFTISGTPEVATEVDVKFEDTFKDVYLKAGTYTDYTKKDANGNYSTFTLTQDYYPIMWTLEMDDNGTVSKFENKSLSTIKAYIEANAANWKYAPNENLAATFKLSWAWTFEQGKDEADTLLGNLAAGTATLDNSLYSTGISYDMSITVTQID